jgi:hypothetical protein
MITVDQSRSIFQLMNPRLLRVVCAWCRLTISEGPSAPVSHGICSACAAQFEKGGAR